MASPLGAKPAAAPPAGAAAAQSGSEGSGPFLPDPKAPFGIQLEQSFENVWKSMQAESGAAAGQLRADLLPKNLADLKANLLRFGGDPLAIAAKLGLDTSSYLFSPVTGAAKQLAGAPVEAATGSKTAGEVAGNAAAAAAAAGMIGGPAGEEGTLAKAAGSSLAHEADEAASGTAAPKAADVAPRMPWREGFPDLVVQKPTGNSRPLTSQPDYDAAKAGDLAAAKSVVDGVLDDSNVDAIRAQIGDSKPLIVPVHAEEAAGRNKLPVAYADALAGRLGLEVSPDITQDNLASRTASEAASRMVSRVEFDGPVTPGQDYYLVDDHATMGGTLADLRSYIEARGGNVIGASTLTASRRGGIDSAVFAPAPETLQALGAKFPELAPWYKETFGDDVTNLTAKGSTSSASRRLTPSERASLKQDLRQSVETLKAWRQDGVQKTSANSAPSPEKQTSARPAAVNPDQALQAQMQAAQKV